MPKRTARVTELDATAQAIVAALQQDGRRPYASIGRDIGMSEAAVRQRVGRLQEAGVLRITAIMDPATLGRPRLAMLGIRVAGDLAEAAAAVEAVDGVVRVAITAGGFDLIAEAACTDDEHLLSVINDGIRAMPSVVSAEAFIYLHQEGTAPAGARHPHGADR